MLTIPMTQTPLHILGFSSNIFCKLVGVRFDIIAILIIFDDILNTLQKLLLPAFALLTAASRYVLIYRKNSMNILMELAHMVSNHLTLFFDINHNLLIFNLLCGF